MIAGHTHRFRHVKPGERGNNYPIVIVGQDQVARVDATGERIKVAVIGKDGAVVDTIVVERKR